MRASGYYWVKVVAHREWRVAEWDGEWWNVPTLKYLVPDDRLHEIDECQIERGEHKDLHRPAMDIIREKVQAEQQRDELLAELEEARQMVVDWSNYASDYFKEKHCLANDIAQLDAAIAKAKAAQAGEKI